MKTILQEQRRSSVIVALITMVLGAVLVVWPDRSVRLMCTLLGAALLICGLVYILGWLVRRREGGISAFTLIPGVVLSGLGIWLMTSSDSVIALVQYVFGAVVIFHGVLDVQSSVSLMRQGAARWWLDLALSALTLALGALILINPFGTFAALMTLVGLSLVTTLVIMAVTSNPDRPGADLRRAQRPVDHPPAEPDGAGPGAGSEWGHHRDKGAGLG